MKQLRNSLICLTLCMMLAVFLTVPAAAKFQDVPSGHWAAESIQRCADLGFFKGQSDTCFGLGQKMTRASFAVVLCRFFGWEMQQTARPPFSDVPANAWYAGAVETAYSYGAITNQQENFRPDDFITREELAVMLVRAMGYGSITGLAQELPMPFRDVTTNAGYISMAYSLGLVKGTSADSFSPEGYASREQVAVMLTRMYDKLHGDGPALTAIVSGPTDLTGLDVVAVPAARLGLVSGEAKVSALMEEAESAAIREAAHQAGAQALLHVTGGISALSIAPDKAATVLKEAVQNGNWDGLFLNISGKNEKSSLAMTQLAKALQTVDVPLYLSVQAPVWNGTQKIKYDYKALAAAADYLVLQIAAYEKTVNGEFPVAPMDPLEEVYYALTSLQDVVAPEKISLMLTTTPSVWQEGKQLTDGEWNAEKGEVYYSDRYACAYCIEANQNGEEIVTWFLNRQGAQARLWLARAFGAGQICLSDWSAASEELLAGLTQ